MILAKLIERILPVEVGYRRHVSVRPEHGLFPIHKFVRACHRFSCLSTLGVRDAGKLAEEKLSGINMHQRHVVVMAEQVDDALRLVEPQQAVIDEHAGELIADRLMDQHGHDRGVDAA